MPDFPSFIEMARGAVTSTMLPLMDKIEQDSRRPGQSITPAQKAWDDVMALHRKGVDNKELIKALEEFTRIRDTQGQEVR